MNRSFSGITEGYLLTPGQLALFASGQAITGYKIPFGISTGKELKTEEYDAPTDAFGNKLRNKKLIPINAETHQADLSTLDTIRHFAATGGVDVMLVHPGWSEYDGTPSAVPLEGGGTYWRINTRDGIFFFEYANRAHMGIGFKFELTPKKQSIMINLEAALTYKKWNDILNAAPLNVVHRDNVSLPWYTVANQYVTECKQVQYYTGAAWVDIFEWDEIQNRVFSIETVSNKNEKDSREHVNLIDITLEVTGTDARPAKIAELNAIAQYSKIRLVEEGPGGEEYIYTINANVLNSTNDLLNNTEKRDLTFKLKGRSSIERWRCYPLTRSMTIGI